MPQIKENFFEAILFKYNNNLSDCVTDIEHTVPGEAPTIKYKIQSLTEHTATFAYAAKKGLVRIAPNGTIEEPNVLGSLIALPTRTDKALIDFFHSNGFLFPTSVECYEEIDKSALIEIINRLKMTVELMTAANEIKKDYQKIFELTILLLLSRDIEFKTDLMNSPYKSCHHSFSDLLRNPPSVLSQQRQKEGFSGDFYNIDDSIIGNNTVIISEYNDIISGYSSVPGYNEPLFKSVIQLYVNYNGNGIARKIIDVLFHCLYDVSIINFTGAINYYKSPDFNSLSQSIKTAMTEVANYIVGEEINANLNGIHPVYNVDTMSPSWKVDSLLCAAYFSIFYLKPDLELYRPCDNPRCGKYFLVKTTSTRNRYCSTECCNRVTQDRYRKKKRELAEN